MALWLRVRLLAGGVLVLAGCGGAAQPNAAAPAPVATSAPAPVAAQPTAAPAPTTPGAPSAATAASASASATGPLYKGIAQSRTPDGFYALGAPAAPVALTDYSDFL